MRDEPDIADVEKFGASTRYEVVRAEIGDGRGWLSGAPVCSDLKMHHIAHVGRMWAKQPFKVIRADASGSFVLVGVEGQGEALIDGEWRVVESGRHLFATRVCAHGYPRHEPESVEVCLGALHGVESDFAPSCLRVVQSSTQEELIL